MQPSLKLVVTLSGICGCEIATELEEVLPTCQFVEEAGAKKAEVIACRPAFTKTFKSGIQPSSGFKAARLILTSAVHQGGSPVNVKLLVGGVTTRKEQEIGTLHCGELGGSLTTYRIETRDLQSCCSRKFLGERESGRCKLVTI